MGHFGRKFYFILFHQFSFQLPASLRHTNSVTTFKCHLETMLFTAACGVTDN